MLRAFGFITHVHHPHKQMLNYCQVIRADQAHHALMQEAWSIVNDRCGVYCCCLWLMQLRPSLDSCVPKPTLLFSPPLFSPSTSHPPTFSPTHPTRNDSLRTTLCLRFKPHIIACGAIFFAARRLAVALPEEPPWWRVFDVEEAQMYEVVRTMHDLYQRPRAEYIPVFRHIVPSKPPTPVLSPAAAPAAGGAGVRAGDGSADRRRTPLPLGADGGAGSGGDKAAAVGGSGGSGPARAPAVVPAAAGGSQGQAGEAGAPPAGEVRFASGDVCSVVCR
jgi:hypothetical protein